MAGSARDAGTRARNSPCVPHLPRRRAGRTDAGAADQRVARRVTAMQPALGHSAEEELAAQAVFFHSAPFVHGGESRMLTKGFPLSSRRLESPLDMSNHLLSRHR